MNKLIKILSAIALMATLTFENVTSHWPLKLYLELHDHQGYMNSKLPLTVMKILSSLLSSQLRSRLLFFKEQLI